MNEGISKDDFSVKYSSFDDAVDLVRTLGSGTYMAKLDIRHVFIFVPFALTSGDYLVSNG